MYKESASSGLALRNSVIIHVVSPVGIQTRRHCLETFLTECSQRRHLQSRLCLLIYCGNSTGIPFALYPESRHPGRLLQNNEVDTLHSTNSNARSKRICFSGMAMDVDVVIVTMMVFPYNGGGHLIVIHALQPRVLLVAVS